MASTQSFPLLRGRSMRATRLNGCGVPVSGPDSVATTDGYVSIALTAEINEPEEIEVKNANGQVCVRDPGCAEFKGYNVEITFCNVEPCLYAMMTGQDTINASDGQALGFRMNSKRKACDYAFALEVWSGVPGVACGGQTAESGSFGYVILPFVRAGVIGDFTIENAAVSFVVSGAVTLDGNSWGTGPYDVYDATGQGEIGALPEALDPDDHMVVMYTTVAPPAPVEGCTSFPPPDKAAAKNGDVFPPDSQVTAQDATNAAKLVGLGYIASPNTAWTTGQHITIGTYQFNWSGTAWVAGAHALAAEDEAVASE